MKYYRNKANLRLTFSSIKREIHPGQIAEFNEKSFENERFQKDVELYIGVGYLEEVKEGAKPIVFESAKPVTSVIVPKDVKPQEMGQVVLPEGIKQEEEGQVIVAGQERMPGQGEAKPLSEFVSGQVKKAGQILEDATKDKKPADEVKKKRKSRSPKI